MQTIDPTMARPESRTRRRRRVVAACVAVALLAGLGVKLWLDRRAPSPDADAGQVARYMATPAFAALSNAQKAPYLDAYQRAKARGELTPDQVSGVNGNVEMGGQIDPVVRYFSLPRGKEREKFLDDVIDRVLQAEKERKLHPPQNGEWPKEMQVDGRRPADAEPPEDRARMSQFLQDLHDRRTARGVPDDGKFLFPRAP